MKCDCTNRFKVKRGSALPHAKLTEDDVRLIRQLHEYKRREIERLNRELSAKGLAEKFGVHYRTVEKVLMGETWYHVPPMR